MAVACFTSAVCSLNCVSSFANFLSSGDGVSLQEHSRSKVSKENRVSGQSSAKRRNNQLGKTS
jgi:hypothetical protein